MTLVLTSILTAGSAQLTAIRQQAIDRQLLAADMPAAAQATRVYDDYLRALAKTHPDDLAVLAVSLIGPRNQVAKLVRHLELLPLVMPIVMPSESQMGYRVGSVS
jgi:hypothetical protein